MRVHWLQENRAWLKKACCKENVFVSLLQKPSMPLLNCASRYHKKVWCFDAQQYGSISIHVRVHSVGTAVTNNVRKCQKPRMRTLCPKI